MQYLFDPEGPLVDLKGLETKTRQNELFVRGPQRDRTCATKVSYYFMKRTPIPFFCPLLLFHHHLPELLLIYPLVFRVHLIQVTLG